MAHTRLQEAPTVPWPADDRDGGEGGAGTWGLAENLAEGEATALTTQLTRARGTGGKT